MKCVLKMAELPLAAAQLHSHVCGWADVLREDGRTDRRVEIKDGCKAPHHQTQLHSTPKKFENLRPSKLLYTFKLTFSEEKGGNKSKFRCISVRRVENLRLSDKNVKVCCGSERFTTRTSS